MVAYLGTQGTEMLQARAILRVMFDALGVSGLILPAIIVVSVLLAWHVIRRDPWRVSLPAIAISYAESLVWTVLLVAAGTLIGGALVAPAAGASPAGDGGLFSRISIALGAGLYEEFVFRLVLIAAAGAVLGGLFRLPSRFATPGAIGIAAVAFALAHQGAPANAVVFAFIAGVYLGFLQVRRGFAVVVLTHAFYDLVALGVLTRS